MHNFKNYIFDLDGTILNSSKEVLKCFKKAFDMASFEINPIRLNPNVIGPPLKEIVKNIAPNIDEKNLNIVMANFRKLYDNETNDISEFYEDVYKFLKQLKANGNKVFMATFKPTAPTLRIVKQFGLNMFDDIYTIDKFDKHITKSEMLEDIISKHELIKSETVMIGDAVTDMIAAKDAGICGIGVLWGYGDDKAELINNASITVKDTKELEKCLK